MNQFPSIRFTKGLSSGFPILAIFALVFGLSGNVESAKAADNPAATAKSSQDSPIEVPGSFKNLPGAKDAVTSKRSVEELDAASTNQLTRAQIEIDEKKGVTFSPKRSVTVNPDKRVAISTSSEVDKSDFQDFHATAYCLKGRTASGAAAQAGVIAADPKVLPLGTVVRIQAGRYTGTYTVADTGGRIKGRIIDVYVPSYREAMQFGRRPVKIKVVGRANQSSSASRKSTVIADIN